MSTRTAIVTGASRGFGRATAIALVNAGVHVIGVARDGAQLDAVQHEAGAEFTPVAADATDPLTAGRLVDTYHPDILILNAGAQPLPRPIHKYSWETFSTNWEVDVRHVFNWTREALLAPLDPGSVVVAVSSGAALMGSSIGGGYSGAKATILFMTGFAAEESNRENLGIRFVTAVPGLNAGTALGRAAATAHAKREGVSLDSFLQRLDPALTPERVGQGIADLAMDSQFDSGAYRVTANGLAPVG
jgi:NAD(P)-dependent dehydrogenase (short-subunit alcohol dehydrogenase family)